MEANTLKSKKQFKKGKLKKNIKNVICRPDPIFWPQISENERTILEDALNNYKVEIPEFKKPYWKELNQIPKHLRPKPPPIQKVEGLIFGVMACQKAIDSKECTGLLIEAAVNPKTIVQPLLESCTEKSIPILCLQDLKVITKRNFGIPTTALGVKADCLEDLKNILQEIFKQHRPSMQESIEVHLEKELCTDTDKKETLRDNDTKTLVCPYLYRTDKKSRVFTPCADKSISSSKFVGQDFIKLSKIIPQERMDRKQYMKMIVKKISNNPNRRKVAKAD